MKAMLLLSTATLLAFFVSAQDDAMARQRIETQIDAFINSWNKHDFSDLANYTTADVDWVNVVGMWWKGQRQVQFAHDAFHKGMFRNVTLSKVSTEIRFIAPDVAVVHWISRAGAYTTPVGQQVPEGNSIATLVFVQKNGQWLITACENIGINESAQMGDPARHMPTGH
jgi:uncharacterized protein (TIGR02246 family)